MSFRFAVPPELRGAVEAAGADWHTNGKIDRFWQKDPSLWTKSGEQDWLGWIDIAERGEKQLAGYAALAADVKSAGFESALLVGMGGSSLCPEVLSLTFGRQPGFPALHIVDSTDPAQVKSVRDKLDLAKTLIVVASKSGSTLEPNILKQYFFAEMTKAVGADKAGSHFIAITDPGSKMEQVAKADGFRHIFYGDPQIGGRYSALSNFGVVAATIAGLDIARLFGEAAKAVASAHHDQASNPAVQLGLLMGTAANAGRDKITLFTSPEIHDLGAWLEQLIAESTGKDGKGLVPIDGEPLGDPTLYGNDRFFIDLRTEGEDDTAHDEKLAALEKAGHPVVHIVMQSIEHIGQEFFRFELATAVAGSVLGINPFNQPDVEAAKIKTRELTAAFEKSGKLPAEKPVMSSAEVDLYTDSKNADDLRKAGANGDLHSWLKAHLGRSGADDYVALLAYIERDAAHIDSLQHMRLAVRDKRHVATCAEFGPRFLHSTGQAYKGGTDSGVFLQITSDDARDIAVPGQKASFGIIKAAQARGDFDVLTDRGRRALRVHLKGDLAS